jgi:tetratricopeptide (TPR) repeat protein
MHWLGLEGFAHAGPWPALFGYLVTAVVIGLLFRWRRRDPAAAWFLLLAVLMLLPVSNLLPLPFLLVASYRAALSWIGISALLGHLLGGALDSPHSSPGHRRAAYMALPVILAVYSVWHGGLTVWGAMQWRSEIRIFSRILAYDPGSIVARAVYSDALERNGRHLEAARVEEETLEQIFGSGAWREWRTAEEALRTDPRIAFRTRRNQGSNEDPRIWIVTLYAQLASCLLGAGDHTGAQHALEIGDHIWPNHLRVHLGMGYYAARRGDYAEAIRRYQSALAIDSSSVYAHSGLGYAYAYQLRWPEAAGEFEAWARLEPTSQEAKRMLSSARKEMGRSRNP